VYRHNVFIARAWGLRLAHELALLKIADVFIGTSSGFATFATFTDVAYAIVNVEHSFARPAGVRLNDRHFPFAKENQILTWRQETTAELLALFEQVYSSALRARMSDGEKRSTPAEQRGPDLLGGRVVFVVFCSALKSPLGHGSPPPVGWSAPPLKSRGSALPRSGLHCREARKRGGMLRNKSMSSPASSG